MLKQRIIVAAVLAPLFISAIFYLSSEQLSLLLALIVALAAYEWAGFVQSNKLERCAYAIAVIGLGWLILNHLTSPDQTWLYSLAVIWWLLIFIALVLYQCYQIKLIFSRWWVYFSGLLTLLPTWCGLIWLHQLPEYGPKLVLYVFLIVWLADSGAYIVGRLWGRNTLASGISPGKTWEGVFGGIVLVLLLAIFAMPYFIGEQVLFGMVHRQFIIISVLISLMSVVGDLNESLMKRFAGVKDSGRILPGHGGILDRIDSLTAAVPIFVLSYMLWLSQQPERVIG